MEQTKLSHNALQKVVLLGKLFYTFVGQVLPINSSIHTFSNFYWSNLDQLFHVFNIDPKVGYFLPTLFAVGTSSHIHIKHVQLCYKNNNLLYIVHYGKICNKMPSIVLPQLKWFSWIMPQYVSIQIQSTIRKHFGNSDAILRNSCDPIIKKLATILSKIISWTSS